MVKGTPDVTTNTNWQTKQRKIIACLEVASLRRAFKSCGTGISFNKVPAVRLGIGPNN